jgi:hypothetical protein
MAVATTGSITLQQLMRHPYVLKVISRIKAQGQPLSNFYGLGVGDSGSETIPAGIRSFSYDIFDHTRQLGSIRPPKTGPNRGRAQKTGTRTGHIIRAYESLPIAWEDIVNTRPHGAAIGTLDKNGQDKVTRQIKHYTEKMMNLREWVVSRMFRGSFQLKYEGDKIYVVDSGGDLTVDYGLPAAHKSQLALGTGGADLIDAPWDTTTTDVITQFLKINKTAERLTGWVVEHVWINSTTLGWLMNNTKLQATGGSAFRTFDSLQWRDMSTIDGGSRKRGFDVVFRGMPWITFHIYDGVLQKGNALADSTSIDETELLIPDGVALMTPAPGEWCAFAEGQEPVTRTLASNMEIMTGFNTFRRPMNDPAGVELHFLDNFFPYTTNSQAWFYATVDF